MMKLSNRTGSLEKAALKAREHIIRMSAGGGCFIGASLSCVDLLVYLYDRVLSISPSRVSEPNRDYFFLSKGHDVPALYAVLAERGFIDRARLRNHLSTCDSIYWHPNRAVPGVEFHSGSLGHLLSVAAGVALDIRIQDSPNRVFVLLGDGELNEGSIWEACLVAAAQKLDNLVVIVDRNGFQANVETETLLPLEPLTSKFRSFGWSVATIDGHNFDDIADAFSELPFIHGTPTAIIANTRRGKGLPSIEGRADRWFVRATAAEVETLLEELHTGEMHTLDSEPLMVR